MKYVNDMMLENGSLSGNVNGTINLQASCDSSPPVNWTTIANGTLVITADGSFLFNFSNAGYGWVRVTYTSSTGTGNLSVRINTKGV